ncbi:innate immunity activator protein [Tachysurus vachellii]|uniref:innate immunity activator protein n=1 Tax=Tachysurus vachellii TaxID=175792 RepID=UPI00296AAB1F|nr:innate immunity activator protein [Tachysurus vachellii]
MDCKEEISDSDSGIILNSGPDSPTSPVKDLSTHTRVIRLKHQALEDRLELCLLELKKLCIREAELTGKLSSEYPLLPNEKPPQIRRRVGASFKLDEGLLPHGNGEKSELHSLEADLALQRQIYEASRRLSLEENISKPVRKSRLQQCKHEEKKMKELQEAVMKHCINQSCISPKPCRSSRQRDLCISDDSSLSDAAAHDDDLEPGPLSPMTLDSGSSFQHVLTLSPHHGSKHAGSRSSLEYNRSPIQNIPWTESSLDQPYQKHKKLPSASSSRSSSPTGSSIDQRLDDIPPAPQFVFKSLAMRNNNSSSTPSTPELPLRRHISQSFRFPRTKPEVNKPSLDLSRGRTKLPRRRVTDFALAYSVQRLYQCSSEDSSSEHSISSYSSSSSHELTSELTKACPPPYGFHCTTPNNSQGQRSTNNILPKNNQTVNKQINKPTVTSPCQNNSYDRMLPERDIRKLNLDLTSLHTNKQQIEVTSPKRLLKPPPPYHRLARTPSLKEYPNHPSRLLPRDVVTNDLRAWHERNNVGEIKFLPLERHGSMRAKRTPDQEPPPYHQIQSQRQTPQKVILQRAPDGTPLQWYEEEDCEIVSQV